MNVICAFICPKIMTDVHKAQKIRLVQWWALLNLTAFGRPSVLFFARGVSKEILDHIYI